MKKFYAFMVLFTLALTGCANDDKSTVYNDAAGTDNVNLKANCAVGPFTGFSAFSQSNTPGSAVTFLWDQGFGISGTNYVSTLEIRNSNLVECSSKPAISNSSYSVNYIGGTSFTLSPGINTRCFQWRIVVKGYQGGVLTCTSESAWQLFSYL